MGNSNGGSFALLVMQWLLARRMPMPAGAVLISPWTDFSLSGESMYTNEDQEFMINDYMITTKVSHWIVGKNTPL